MRNSERKPLEGAYQRGDVLVRQRPENQSDFPPPVQAAQLPDQRGNARFVVRTVYQHRGAVSIRRFVSVSSMGSFYAAN